MSGTKNHRGWGWIRKRASGRYQASFVGPDLNRHYASTTFTNRMTAERWLAQERDLKERAAALGEPWISPAERAALNSVARATLAEYGKQIIEQRDIKPRTRIHYSSLLEDHIAQEIGKLPIDKVTPQAVRSWYAKTLTDKPTMRAHAYGLLSSICNTAVKDGLLHSNPCQISGAMHAKTKRDIAILEVAEIAALADAIRPERFKALVLISAWSGLRYGEVTELRRKDIGEGCEVISISRAVTHRPSADSDKRCYIGTPKSDKTRTVVVPPHIRADIKHHLDTFVDADPESLLFAPARGGCHLIDKVFRDSFVAPTEKLGPRRRRIHDLRHFSGRQVARVGNLVETMNHLGHSTPAASLRYQHVVSGRDVEIANQLSALAAGPKLAVVADEPTESSA